MNGFGEKLTKTSNDAKTGQSPAKTAPAMPAMVVTLSGSKAAESKSTPALTVIITPPSSSQQPSDELDSPRVLLKEANEAYDAQLYQKAEKKLLKCLTFPLEKLGKNEYEALLNKGTIESDLGKIYYNMSRHSSKTNMSEASQYIESSQKYYDLARITFNLIKVMELDHANLVNLVNVTKLVISGSAKTKGVIERISKKLLNEKSNNTTDAVASHSSQLTK